MSRALVIKNANFSANKLATVSFIVEKPCTALSLSADSLSFTTLTPQTLTATKTPADTTDTLYWASSDESVVTVADGVVTPHKSGTATITATCGSQTATCSVTAAISVPLDVSFTLGYYFAKVGPNNETVAILASNDYGGTLSTVSTTGSDTYANDPSHVLTGQKAYPIALPAGAKKINVTVPDQNLVVTYQLTNSKQSPTGYVSNPTRVVGSYYADSGTAGDRTIDISSYTTADSVYLSIYKKTASTFNQDVLDAVTVTVDL